jgi:hypothetical protein
LRPATVVVEPKTVAAGTAPTAGTPVPQAQAQAQAQGSKQLDTSSNAWLPK